MADVTVPADAENHSLTSLLGAAAPMTGFGNVWLLAANDELKVGNSNMTDEVYDYKMRGEREYDEGNVMLQTRVVRNDTGSPIVLNIRVRST
jgi:hypothetical protein